LIERVITISGDVDRKGNFLVPLGIQVKDIIKILNINVSEINKLVFGGPMMGIAQDSLETSVIKGTSGILLFKNNLVPNTYMQCIRCSKCVMVCPMKLMPNFLSLYIEHEKWDKVQLFSPFDCIECGCCSYVCVAKRPIVAQIKYAKSVLMSKK
jgi:electron transport complex protein RnfC